MKLKIKILKSQTGPSKSRPCLGSLMLFLGLCLSPLASAQQIDRSFREFSRGQVPTPTELFRTLRVLKTDNESESNLQSALQSSVMKQLAKSGRELLSNMTPEQKQTARAFAEKFLAENGLESDEGKALMNQLEIPPDVQSQLADLAKGLDADGKQKFSSFAELLSQDQSPSSRSSSTPRSSNPNRQTSPETSSNDSASSPSTSANNIGEVLKKAADSLGTGSSKQASESTFKKIFNGAKNTLTGPSDDSAKSKERITSRFDRVLFESANRILDPKSESSTKLELPKSVRSALKRAFGKVQDSFNPQERRSENAIPPDMPTTRSSFNDRNVAQNSLDTSNQSSDRTIGEFETSGSADLADSLTLDGLPKLNPNQLFFIMAIIGIAGLVAYFVWQFFTDQSRALKPRRFGRRLGAARLRSPNDLVEAVDQLIVSNFGQDSRCWNDRQAKEALCSRAPQYRATIGELLGDYVRARYTAEEVALQDEVQKKYKMTLKQLANLQPVPDAPLQLSSGNEG